MNGGSRWAGYSTGSGGARVSEHLLIMILFPRGLRLRSTTPLVLEGNLVWVDGWMDGRGWLGIASQACRWCDGTIDTLIDCGRDGRFEIEIRGQDGIIRKIITEEVRDVWDFSLHAMQYMLCYVGINTQIRDCPYLDRYFISSLSSSRFTSVSDKCPRGL